MNLITLLTPILTLFKDHQQNAKVGNQKCKWCGDDCQYTVGGFCITCNYRLDNDEELGEKLRKNDDFEEVKSKKV